MTKPKSGLRPDLSLPDAIKKALGKIPSGHYVATAMVEGQPIGLLCPFVAQAGFDPPMITIAIAPNQPLSPGLKPGGAFGLHIFGKPTDAVMKLFTDGHSAEAFTHAQVGNPFEVPQFAEASAFLIARVKGFHAAGDHIVYLAEVLDGVLQHGRDESMVRTTPTPTTDPKSDLRPDLSKYAAIAPALGKIPRGQHLATAMWEGQPTGMLCSFVEQAGPQMITLAISPDGPLSPALNPGADFGLHILGKSNTPLVKSFAHGPSPKAFESHVQVGNRFKVPQFAEALAFLVARVKGALAVGDHIVYLAEVLDGVLQHKGDESMVCTRANGFKN